MSNGQVMLSKGKSIGLALAVALLPQLARCQAAGDGTTNANKAAAAPAVSVSVGPIVATNTCLIATASDANALKCELVAEVNKAKSELAEQNRERMDALGEKYEAKCKEAIADVESRSKQRFDELKGVLDEEKDTIDKTTVICYGVLGVLGILIALYGIQKGSERKADYEKLKKTIDDAQKEWQTQMAEVGKTKANFVVLQGKLEQGQKELEQRIEKFSKWTTTSMEAYDVLKRDLKQQKTDSENLIAELKDQQKSQAEQFAKNLEQQKADSEKLIDELKGQQKSQAEQFAKAKGKLEKELIICKYDIAFSHGEQYWICYKKGNDVDDARLAVGNFAEAVVWGVKSNLVWNLSNAINWLDYVDKELTSDGNKSKVQDMLKNKNWHWKVSPDEVKKVLDAATPKQIVGNGTYETFERIYKEYGLPKV